MNIEHRIEQVETTNGTDAALALFKRLGEEGWQFSGVLQRLVSSGPFRSYDVCVFTRAAATPEGP